jgi:hypothetical protein
MITPIQALPAALGISPLAFTSIFLFLFLLVFPFFSTLAAAAFTRPLEKTRASLSRTISVHAIAFAPLGFGMWLAHFVFHLFTGSHTAVPVLERLLDIEPNWAIKSWAWPGLLGVELLLLDAGLLLTFYALWRIAKNRSLRPLRAALPWLILSAALYAFGAWVIFQPMQMRGTLTP